MEKTRIILSGAAGRMGREILSLVAGSADLELVSALESEGHPMLGMHVRDIGPFQDIGDVEITATIPESALAGGSVLVDFSVPGASLQRLGDVAGSGVAAVIGTTGFDEEQTEAIQELAERTAVVRAPNMSVGVNLLFKLVAEASKCLGPAYDVEIVEMHHVMKKDAPSGTALRLADSVQEGSGRAGDKVFGRHGTDQSRKEGEIGIHAVRAGDVVGEHTVYFVGPGERVELTHRCSSRSNFAAGALRAARWVRDKKPGLYDMMDVLGL